MVTTAMERQPFPSVGSYHSPQSSSPTLVEPPQHNPQHGYTYPQLQPLYEPYMPDRDRDPTRLYLGNLPRTATHDNIKEHFGLYASGVTEVKLMNGFGFVEFDDPLDASRVVQEFHGSMFMEQRMVVTHARGRRKAETREKNMLSPPISKPKDDHKQILIGIDYGTTFSGVAWALPGELISPITHWPAPNRGSSEKVPTRISYGLPLNEEIKWGNPIKPTTPGSVRVFEIPGLLERSSISALGDYCAKKNFMNESFARRAGLHINKEVTCSVPVGSGKIVQTTGEATAAFSYRNETTAHVLKFHLLPNCIHDVILGKTFLKATKTFSNQLNFIRRVTEKIMKGISQFHLLYLGASSPKFEGFVNGIRQTALADTGAKVPIIDEDWARRNGLKITTGSEHRERLRFADDSKAWTSGMAYGVEWRFDSLSDSTPYPIDFHVLKNAPAEVILCDTFLFDACAFSRYEDCLIDDDDDDDDSSCFAIDRDTTVPQEGCQPISLERMEFHELVRRGREDDRILNLPKQDQEAARLAETRRRSEWDAHLASLKSNQSGSAGPSLFHISTPPIPPTPNLPTSTSLHSANPLDSPPSGISRSLKRVKRLLGLKT